MIFLEAVLQLVGRQNGSILHSNEWYSKLWIYIRRIPGIHDGDSENAASGGQWNYSS